MPPFDWLDYLPVAEHLLSRDGEASFRASASRSYYGVFGAIRVAFETRAGIRFSRDGVHGQVIQAVRADQRPDISLLAEHLDRLRRRRVHADYDPQRPFARSHARRAYRLAQLIKERTAVL